MSFVMREIPLQPNSQILAINISNIMYTFNIIWRDAGYVLDIQDVYQNNIVTGLSLVTGADLIDQLTYLDLPFSLVVVSDVDSSLVPTYTSLGQQSHLCVVYDNGA